MSGLAHLLEHMLFMGSVKYPGEHSFDSYIKLNGGSSNAFTGDDMTVYYFDVQQEYFSNALHRFAQVKILRILYNT